LRSNNSRLRSRFPLGFPPPEFLHAGFQEFFGLGRVNDASLEICDWHWFVEEQAAPWDVACYFVSARKAPAE
jgi:hypothetical protein